MNSVSFQEQMTATRPEGQDFQYRSVSKSAIASLAFAMMGMLTSFLAPIFVLLPALGAGFGLVSIFNFRRYPDELVGKFFANTGLFVSLGFLFGSVAWHSYVYATEVPEGYERISYSMLRDNTKTPLPFSEKAEELDGKKVFLKGYVRPSDKKTKLKNFILVGDFGECCFGGNPKPTEIVAINILSEDTVNYSFALRRIGGVFRLNRNRKQVAGDVPPIFYEIEADHVK
jgi:hypothetical protein